MPLIFQKNSPRLLAFGIAAAVFALSLTTSAAQAHPGTTGPGHNCAGTKATAHAQKAGAKKKGRKKMEPKVQRKKKNQRGRLRAHLSGRGAASLRSEAPTRYSLDQGYRRIPPEPTCNMEPAFAVPACEARLKAAGYDVP